MMKSIFNLLKSKKKRDENIQEDIGIVSRVVRPIKRGIANRKNIQSPKHYEKIRKNL